MILRRVEENSRHRQFKHPGDEQESPLQLRGQAHDCQDDVNRAVDQPIKERSHDSFRLGNELTYNNVRSSRIFISQTEARDKSRGGSGKFPHSQFSTQLRIQ